MDGDAVSAACVQRPATTAQTLSKINRHTKTLGQELSFVNTQRPADIRAPGARMRPGPGFAKSELVYSFSDEVACQTLRNKAIGPMTLLPATYLMLRMHAKVP